MFVWIRARRAERRRKDSAIRRAIEEFRARRGFAPMGAHVLHLAPQEAIVRVMYMAGRKPPDRAWFAVAEGGGAVRELTFDEVASLETPWR